MTGGGNYGDCAADLFGQRLIANQASPAGLNGNMSAVSPAAAHPAGAPLAGDWLHVFGLIHTNTGQANISYLHRLSSVAEIPVRTPGPYSLQLLNAGGAVLADYPFTPYPADGIPSQLNFDQVVAFAAGTVRVRLVNASGQALSTATLSAHAPTVSNVILQGAPNPVSGVVTVTWTASDLDGDPLHFDLLYSRDGGASFLPFYLNISTTSVPIDTSLLGGGVQAVLRVVASDGSQTGQADSAAFTMAAKPPQMRILSPANGTQVHYGQLVNLSGEALDLQDGGVSGDDLVWTNQRGLLGTGSFLALTDLPVGINWITLTATNTVGLAASASVTVTVDDDLNLPGPTLSVGPLQIGWHVAPGATQPQTATLSVSNAGSGVLTYTVSSNATWLTVNPTGGVAPATVVLAADPTGLGDGTLVKANVVVRGTGDADGPTQAITVPVSLVVGIVPPGGRVRMYLPLALKR